MSMYEQDRPACLDDMLGNADVLSRVRNHFKETDHNHFIVIYGDSGCGKSTLARLIATEIIGADPLAVDEINAADQKERTDVEKYMEKATRFPTFGDVNVQIWNECQELTPTAKSAMLDPLEHIPPQSYYIFTTTNPNAFFKGSKGEKTNALSTRCSRFELKPLDERDSDELVDRVLSKRGRELPQSVRDAIVKVSGGSGRLIVNNVEACLSCADETEMLSCLHSGAENDADIIGLCFSMAYPNSRNAKYKTWRDVSVLLQRIKESGMDPEQVRRTIAGYMSSCLIGKDGKGKELDKRVFTILKYFSTNTTYETGFPELVAMIGEVYDE